MAVKVKDLPNDIEALKALLLARDEKIAELEHSVEAYRRMLFGKSSERRVFSDTPLNPAQGHLFARDLVAEAEQAAERTGESGAVETRDHTAPPKKRGRRSKFPEHLPQVATKYELDPAQQTCTCGGELHQIGWETTKELERVETCIVHTIQRATYGCRSCEEGVITAKGPTRVIDKGLLGPGFLAHVASEHLINHLPYYRLEKKYASEGVALSRSVLERSMATCAEILEPIQQQLLRDILDCSAIHTDDTPVTIARGSEKGNRQGRVWIYRDIEGRHAYDFTESRESARPCAILADYKGFVHADAFPGYDSLFLPGGATEVACWAHVRRKILDAEGTEPEIAKGCIARIAKLYAIEKDATENELDPQARSKLRSEEATPVLEELRAYMAASEASILPKSPMATALRYALKLWGALTVYVTDGRLSIDNNPAERALRPIAVGRKNWLFVQTVEGGRRLATLQSLLFTAKEIGLNPADYLADVLVRIAHEPDVAKLTPHGWQEHFEAEVAGARARAVDRLLGR